MKDEMVSDQLYDWSDIQEQERVLLAKEAPSARWPTVTVRSRTSWLSHRAIQTLRQTWLPLCEWTRTRTQVLPVDQSIRSSTRDALCSTKLAGASRALPDRLSEGSRNPGRDCEHQPRALEAAGAFLERRFESYGRHACWCDERRLWRSRSLAGEHARRRVAGREDRERESGGGP